VRGGGFLRCDKQRFNLAGLECCRFALSLLRFHKFSQTLNRIRLEQPIFDGAVHDHAQRGDCKADRVASQPPLRQLGEPILHGLAPDLAEPTMAESRHDVEA